MENSNINPEDDNLQQKADEATATPDATETAETVETTQEERLEPVFIGDSLTVIPVTESPVKKKKTGLFVGIGAAVLAVAAVVGVAVVAAAPEKAVLKAIKATYALSLKQAEQMNADLPVLAKGAELMSNNRETKSEFKLNAMEIPGISPLVSMLMSGSTISGSTVSATDSHTYSNNYSLKVMGQTLGTVNLYNSPTVMAIAVPEFVADSYYLDFDEMVENGWDSFLFSEFMPTSKEDLQAAANMYQGYISSIGSMSTKEAAAMAAQLEKICAETLTNLSYTASTVDGEKLYTVTIPAESVNAMLTAAAKYIYLESPLSGTMTAILPAEERAEFIGNINEMADDIAEVMPTDPTVITMNIKNGIIGNVQILTKGVSKNNSPVRFDMGINDLTGANSTVALKFIAGEGADRVSMDMAVDCTYTDKVMEAVMVMDTFFGSDNADTVKLLLEYRLDGNKQTNNLGLKMAYDVAAEDGTTMHMVVDALGDYYLQDNAVMLAMEDVAYGITAGSPTGAPPISINMSFGMKTSMTPFAGEITMPDSVNILTLSGGDINDIYLQAERAVQKLAVSFLSKLAP